MSNETSLQLPRYVADAPDCNLTRYFNLLLDEVNKMPSQVNLLSVAEGELMLLAVRHGNDTGQIFRTSFRGSIVHWKVQEILYSVVTPK